MVHRLAERFAHGLIRMRLAGRLAGARQGERKRNHDERHEGEHHERVVPAVGRYQGLGDRGEDDLTERAGRGAEAERERAAFGGDHPRDGGEREGKRREGDAGTDEQAAGQLKRKPAVGHRHARDAHAVEEAAERDDQSRTPPIRNRSRDGHANAPQQVLDRHREREGLARPSLRDRERIEIKAEARANPEPEQRDQAGGKNDSKHGDRTEATVGGGNAAHRVAISAGRRITGRRGCVDSTLRRTHGSRNDTCPMIDVKAGFRRLGPRSRGGGAVQSAASLMAPGSGAPMADNGPSSCSTIGLMSVISFSIVTSAWR